MTPEILSALRDPAGPPTVGALAQAFGVTIDPSAVADNGLGIVDVTVSDAGGPVTRLVARYPWSFHSGRITALEELCRQRPFEWTATLARGGDEIEGTLRERFGGPRMVSAHRVYHAYVVTPRGDGGVDLAFYAKLPDWAVPSPDAGLRERVLRELAAAIARAEASDTHEVARLLDALPAGCGLKEDPSTRKRSGFTIELVPAMQAMELAPIFGWQNVVAERRSINESDYDLAIVTGRNPFNATVVTRPALGPWTVIATLAGGPTGADLDANQPQTGPPIGGRTYALMPADLVRTVQVLLPLAPGARPA